MNEAIRYKSGTPHCYVTGAGDIPISFPIFSLLTLVRNEVEIFTEISIYAGCKICHPSDQISKTITLKYFIVYQYLVIRYNLAN